MAAKDLYGEKGFIPFSRIQDPKPRRRKFRCRTGPCLIMLVAAILIATFTFDTFGVKVSKTARYRELLKEKTKPKKPPSTFGGWDKLDRLFIFGESYSDIGFDSAGTQPAIGNPFGNPEFKVGTGIPKFGPMGPIWVHYATTVYNRSAVRTYDLARGGSTIDRDIINPIFPEAGTFGDQIVKQFAPRYGVDSPGADWDSKNSLFAVFFGIMDMIITFHKEEASAPVANLTRSYQQNLDFLYDSGARNFLLFNLPPVDRPYQPNKKGVKELRTDVADFNRGLLKMKSAFEARHRNVNVFLFNTASFFEDLITDPKRFAQTKKITYTKGPCPMYDLGIGATGDINIDRLHPKCGVPVSQYLWHDYIHTTYPTHDALAATVVEDCMGAQKKRYCL